MELNEYQKLAMITKKEWENKDAELIDSALGLCGESGEVADIIKKHLAGSKEMNLDDLKKELGDVLWYLAETCDYLNISLDEIAKLNIEKLKKRHGDKFSGYGDRSNENK
jgi:NTP pyrophosphatase (non-canonical NTP hydrolase)